MDEYPDVPTCPDCGSYVYGDTCAECQDHEGCDYCGSERHVVEDCPDFKRDLQETADRDAATDKSDWPL